MRASGSRACRLRRLRAAAVHRSASSRASCSVERRRTRTQPCGRVRGRTDRERRAAGAGRRRQRRDASRSCRRRSARARRCCRRGQFCDRRRSRSARSASGRARPRSGHAGSRPTRRRRPARRSRPTRRRCRRAVRQIDERGTSRRHLPSEQAGVGRRRARALPFAPDLTDRLRRSPSTPLGYVPASVTGSPTCRRRRRFSIVLPDASMKSPLPT